MPKSLKIMAGEVELKAELNDSPTAEKIAAALPIEGRAQRWGEEIYFAIPVQTELDPDAREEVEVGEMGYWPAGNAFCLFFGPTPASNSEKPSAASAVNILGRFEGDFAVLCEVANGETVTIEASE
jgi:uncharacterized protein